MRVTLLVLIVLFAALLGVSGCASWTAEKNAPAIGKIVEVDGEQVHVLDLGPRNSAKPPLVLIHGASVNLRDMKLALGERLSANRRVIMIDRTGHGYSSRAEDGYKLGVQAALIKGAADALGVENPVVIGQSFGGAVALRYALDFQDEVSGLVLLAAVSHEWPGGIAWYNDVSQWPVAGALLRRLVIPVYGQFSAKSGIASSFSPGTPPEQYYEESGLALLFRPKEFKANAEDIAHLKAEIIAQQGRYGELKIPVAIVTGEDDTSVSPKLHSKRLATEVENSTLTLLPDTGHTLHHSRTDAIIEIINSAAQ
jgi:pimeloyl-ACP methyl ester carboxylesterase